MYLFIYLSYSYRASRARARPEKKAQQIDDAFNISCMKVRMCVQISMNRSQID